MKGSRDGAAMEPVYRCRESQLWFKVMIVITGIGLFILGILPLEGDPPVAIVWMVRSLVLIGPAILLVTPEVRLAAYPEYIQVNYGLTNLIGFRLSTDKITDIRPLTYNPLTDFGGWGIKGGFGDWAGWTAFTASISNTALAIETTEKNYVIGCPDPEEAASVLGTLIRKRPG